MLSRRDSWAFLYRTTISTPALHNSLNIEQFYRIESIQKRATKIRPYLYGPGDYHDICMKQSLPTLASRRTEICTSFFITLY